MNAEAMERVRRLRFANLTPPILAQMRAGGRVWGSLLNIAETLQRAEGQPNAPTGGEWGPDTDAGTLSLKISSKREVRVALRLRSAFATMGPDQLRNRDLDICHIQENPHSYAPGRITLPDTLLVACGGRRVEEIVDPRRTHGALDGVVIKRADREIWGIRFKLDLPFVQPGDEDLEAMLASFVPFVPKR